MSCEAAPLRWLERPGAQRVAYRTREGPAPTVVFLGGFTSDMAGTKAAALDAYAVRRGVAYVRFDYRGHGVSGGAFRDGTIGQWTEDAVAVVDEVTRGPLILVGSSMGAWLAVLVALARPERVAAMVGLAAAPDFPWELMEPALSPEQRAALDANGEVELADRYGDKPIRLSCRFFEEAREHALLDRTVPVRCPVRLLHGLDDADVPWQTSVRLAAALASDDVTVTLVKGADHRLSSDEDLARLEGVVEQLRRPGGVDPPGVPPLRPSAGSGRD